jgi:sugar phosphate permease
VDDRRLLYAAVGARALSIGCLGVVLAFHLADRGFDPADVGHVVAAGLIGTGIATAFVPFVAHRAGPRRTLVGLTLLSAAGIVAVASPLGIPASIAAALFGMLNGAGRDRGPLQAIEHALIAARVEPAKRTKTFALYNLWNDGALAVGSALPWVASKAGLSGDARHAGMTYAAAAVLIPAALAYARLSPAVGDRPAALPPPLSRETRSRLTRLAALFALDSFGGGFLVAALMGVWFHERFGVTDETLALLFAGGKVLNALSHLGAAWLAARIGLLNTMVFTHTPSSLILLTVAFAPSFEVAAVLYLLREGLVEMDVPTRTSYVMAIVAPEERTRVSAVTNLVRIAAWGVAAEISGRLLKGASLVLPLAVAAGIKITYDALLFVSFRRVKPPEE